MGIRGSSGGWSFPELWVRILPEAKTSAKSKCRKTLENVRWNILKITEIFSTKCGQIQGALYKLKYGTFSSGNPPTFERRRKISAQNNEELIPNDLEQDDHGRNSKNGNLKHSSDNVTQKQEHRRRETGQRYIQEMEVYKEKKI